MNLSTRRAGSLVFRCLKPLVSAEIPMCATTKSDSSWLVGKKEEETGNLATSLGGGHVQCAFATKGWVGKGSQGSRPFATAASRSGNMADDLILYARQCQSRSAALETLDHGSQMLERDSQGLEVEGLVRLALVSAELSYLDKASQWDQVERHCNRALALISENDEILNAKFQSQHSLFARHLLTLIYLSQDGKDGLANDLTSAYADVDVSSTAYDFQSEIIGKKGRTVMTGVYEGMKGFCDHGLGAKDLSEESWKKVTATLGTGLEEWGKAKELDHVMKNYVMFKHCLGQGDAETDGSGGSGGSGVEEFDYVAKRAERDSEACQDGTSVELWGCELMLREVELSAKFGAAQVLMKEKKFEEAERRLEDVLQGFDRHFGENDSRTGLIIMKLGDLYTQSKRLTLAEGLYRNAAKLLTSPHSIFDDPTNENLTFSCHPTCVSLLEHSYSKLLQIIPRRDKEAESVLKRAEQRWIDPLNSIEDASARGIVDLQTQRLYYLG